MGTSASNGGPKGAPPLLPDWYDPTPPDKDDDPSQDDDDDSRESPQSDQDNKEISSSESSGNWEKSKGALTRLSNSKSGASIRKAGKKYVNSLGGSRRATKAAAQGRITGKKYASFLGSLSSGGINNALQSLGLEQLVGKSSEEICLAIANSLAPPGTTNDEAIARDALISTLDSLYSKIQEEGDDFSSIENLSLEQVKDTLIEYVSNFIFIKWMYELGYAIEKGSISVAEAIELETEVKDLIFTETIERYRTVPVQTFQINDKATDVIMEEIFQTAYSTLE